MINKDYLREKQQNTNGKEKKKRKIEKIGDRYNKKKKNKRRRMANEVYC